MWDLTVLKNTITIVSSRYFIIAGIAFVCWYVLFKKKIAYKKIQLRFPANKDYAREIVSSLCTMIIFSTVTFILLGNTAIKQHTTYYRDLNQHSPVLLAGLSAHAADT